MFLAIAGVAVMTMLLLNDARNTVKQLPDLAKNEMQVTRNLMDKQLNDLRTQTLTRVDTLTQTTDHRLAAIEKDAANATAVLNGNLNGQMTVLNANLNRQLTDTNTSVNGLTMAYMKLPDQFGQVAKRFDYYTDCDANGLCWQGQLSDVMLQARASSRSTTTAMASISLAMPEITKNSGTISTSLADTVPKIGTNIAGITHNIEVLTHPKWYWRVLGAAAQGSAIYFNLRPLTTTVATVAK